MLIHLPIIISRRAPPASYLPPAPVGIMGP